MAALKYDLGLVHALMEGPASDKASGWLHRGEGSIADLSPSEAASAIEAAVRLKRADRVASAQAEAKDKAVRKLASAAAHRLKSAGVEIPKAETGGTWSLQAEEISVAPPMTLLGFPDPNGMFPFLVVAFGPRDAVAFAGLAGASIGHQDTHHKHLSRSDARNLAWQVRRGHDLHELPPHVALHFLGRAFEEGGTTPHEWDHFSQHLAEGLETSARLLDPLRDQPQEIDEQALIEVEPLLEPGRNLYFALSPEVTTTAYQDITRALRSELELDDLSRTRRLREELDKAADAALDDATRRGWALALDVLTRIAVDSGDSALARAARHTALALKAGKAGHEIPFVRAWTEKQLASVVELASRGGGSRTDRLQASLEEALQAGQTASEE